MTPCTICGAPTAGDDDDDAPCCAWCAATNFAGAELQPLPRVTQGARRREGVPWPWLRLAGGEARREA